MARSWREDERILVACLNHKSKRSLWALDGPQMPLFRGDPLPIRAFLSEPIRPPFLLGPSAGGDLADGGAESDQADELRRHIRKVKCLVSSCTPRPLSGAPGEPPVLSRCLALDPQVF